MMIFGRRRCSSEAPQTVPQFENDWAISLAAADAAYEYVYGRRELKAAPGASWLGSTDQGDLSPSDPRLDSGMRSSPPRLSGSLVASGSCGGDTLFDLRPGQTIPLGQSHA